MKIVLILSFMILCGLTHQQIRGDDTNDGLTLLEKIAKIIRIFIREYVKYFSEHIIVENVNLPLTIKNFSAGYLHLYNLTLYGLENITIDSDTPDLLRLEYDENNKVFTIDSKVMITKKMGLRWEKYDLDLGISDIIPFFGEGYLSLELASIDVSVYVKLSFADGFKVDYLEIIPHLSPVKCTVTGFWNLPDFQNIFSILLTTFADIFVTFWELEIDLISCVISRLLQSILNHEKDIKSYVLQNCKKLAANSSYPIVKSLFINSDQSDLLEYTSEENILKYAQIAYEYLVKEMEAYPTVH